MTREDIYKMARALSRDTSPSSKRLPKYPPLPTSFTRISTRKFKASSQALFHVLGEALKLEAMGEIDIAWHQHEFENNNLE